MENKLPLDFLGKIKNEFSEDEYVQFLNSFNEISPVSIRLNPSKEANVQGVSENVKWCQQGYYLKERPVFTFDPLFQAGAYYVQEASSMFVEMVMKEIYPEKKKVKVLDLSAAPGGKSTHLVSLISEDSLIVANEVIRSRLVSLEENLMKWGTTNYLISNNDPADFSSIESYFDIVLVDAPCSGEGMFRKDREACNYWSIDNVKLCARRQERILSDVLPTLKAGGYLIYSTCTWSKEEDEDNVVKFCEEGFDSVRIPLDPEWKVKESIIKNKGKLIYGYRFYPHLIKGEGFFISCLKKPGTPEERNLRKFKSLKLNFCTQNEKIEAEKWLKNPGEFEFIKEGDQVVAIKKEHLEDFLHLEKKLRLKLSGLRLGKMIRDELIPSHELALSIAVNPDIPSIELDQEEALKYLRKQEIKPETKLKDWVLVKYQGLNIGWIKILKQRVNNYFPMELRIRKQQ